jgi:hypothetical protein
MKKILLMASLAAMFTVASAQASIFSEDLEGHVPAAGTLDDNLGWNKYEPASVGYGPSTYLGSNVILQPGGNNIIHYTVGAGMMSNDVTVLSADMYADDLYNTAGGEAGIGIDSTGNWQTPFLVGPGSNPTNPGYPGSGSGGWLVSDGLNGTGRINITDGGAPGVGARFMGGVGMAVSVSITFDRVLDLISVELSDRALGTPLIPTFVIPLTPAGEANLDLMTDIKLAHFDVHTSGLKEVDNINLVAMTVPVEELNPPTPDPMTWATDPIPIDSDRITMIATTATELENPPVQYFFECTTDNNANSSWQTNPAYTATGLTMVTEYTFKVKARDSATIPNETGWSGLRWATTLFPLGAIFTEDFDNESPASGTLNDHLGYTNIGASVGYGDSATLGSKVALAPASNTFQEKSVPGMAGVGLLKLSYDAYLTGLYDTAGGEGYVGVTDGTNWTNGCLVGLSADPTLPGYPVGTGRWIVYNNLDEVGRMIITDGGSPGVGNDFVGGSNVAVTVEMVIDSLAGANGEIRVDILNRATQVLLNPTFIIPMTAIGKAKVASLSHVALTWNDIHPGDLREVDNIIIAIEATENKASFPDPINGTSNVPTDYTLGWTAGLNALNVDSFDIYFGTDATEVNNAARPLGDLDASGVVDTDDLLVITSNFLMDPTGSFPYADPSGDGNVNLLDFTIEANHWTHQADPQFIVNHPSDSYPLTGLDKGTTYHWRIDEVNNLGAINKGDVWNFTTIPEPVVFSEFTEIIGLSNAPAAWGDWNNDGYVDLAVGGNLYRNNGGTSFTAVSSGGDFFLFADYDNDGDLDYYWFPSEELYRNDSNTFVPAGFPTSGFINTSGSCWGDWDGNGDVDIYSSRHAEYDRIFTNNAGTFTVTEYGPLLYAGRGVTACDFDEDGDMDIYVSNYWQQPNLLWLNNGSGGFSLAPTVYGVEGDPGVGAGFGHTIGSAWGDLDNDGDFDLFTANLNHHDSRQSQDSVFYENLGSAGSWHFNEISNTVTNLAWQESHSNPAFGDYDNDGDLDLLLSCVYMGGTVSLYSNNGDWTFTDVTGEAGLGGLTASGHYQAAWADFNNDGALDLITVGKLFVNPGTSGHWIKVHLAGDGTNVNRDAIGAQVRIDMGDGRILTRQVEAGTGNGNQNEMTLHFGLGTHSSSVTLDITWPDGTTESVVTSVDQRVEVQY